MIRSLLNQIKLLFHKVQIRYVLLFLQMCIALYLIFYTLFDIHFGPDLFIRALTAREIFIILITTLLLATWEELFFRRFLFVFLLKRYGFVTGLLGSALIFAAIHLDTGLGAAINAFVFGCYTAYLYIEQRRLWQLIFVHTFSNLSVFYWDGYSIVSKIWNIEAITPPVWSVQFIPPFLGSFFVVFFSWIGLLLFFLSYRKNSTDVIKFFLADLKLVKM